MAIEEIEDHGELEHISKNMKPHRLEWRFQMVGFIIVSALILAAAFGLLGSGYLSHRTETIGSFELQYERFLRHSRDARLKVTGADQSDRIEISLNGEFVDEVKIENVIPEPEQMILDHGKIKFNFISSPIQGEKQVVFAVVPEGYGWTTLSIGINGLERSFNIFIYP